MNQAGISYIQKIQIYTTRFPLVHFTSRGLCPNPTAATVQPQVICRHHHHHHLYIMATTFSSLNTSERSPSPNKDTLISQFHLPFSFPSASLVSGGLDRSHGDCWKVEEGGCWKEGWREEEGRHPVRQSRPAVSGR